MKDIKVDGVAICLAIVFLANFLFFVFASTSENVLVEGWYYTFDSFELFIIFIYQSLSLFFLYAFYMFFKRINIKKSKENNLYSNKVGLFLIMAQLLLIYVSYTYGYGTVGIRREESTTPYTLMLFLNFFPIEYIFFIISPRLKSDKYFYINLIICIFSAIYRGWMGALFFGLLIILIRNGGININLKKLLKFIIGIFLFICIIPLFIEIKWSLRAGNDVALENIYSSKNIHESANYILSRMQSLGQIQIINESKNFYKISYNNGLIKPYYLDGVVQDILVRRLGNDPSDTLTQYVAKNSFGAMNSNTNTGIIGWFLILGEYFVFFMVYISTLLTIIYSLILRFGTKIELQLLAVFSILFLFHGFIAYFFWFSLYLVMITLLGKIKQFQCIIFR